jgi:hypothetical protein
MIVSFVVMIVTLLMVTNMGGLAESLVTMGFLSFFFIYLLRLLNVINKPFKVGQHRGDDDVSLFILYEFVVYAKMHHVDLEGEQVVAMAEKIEELEEAAFAADTDAAGTKADAEVATADLHEALEVAADDVTDEPPAAKS